MWFKVWYFVYATCIQCQKECNLRSQAAKCFFVASPAGHMSQNGMKVLSRFGYVLGFKFSDFFVCEHCLYGKQTQSPHKRGSSRKSEPLALVHSDVCGPMPTLSMGGAAYFVTFIDDFSRKTWVYPLRRKDEVLSIFKHFVTLVEI